MNLNHLAVFRAVAEHGSFTAAAHALAADKAHVSRVVRALEASLGVVLVTRTTRKVALTPAGEGLLAVVRGPLDALERAGTVVADRAKTPSGLVTLTTTPDLARVLVAPLLPAFRARFPDVSVQVRVGPDVERFADASLDLALRVGRLADPDTRARKLGELGAGFFASPRYLAARGTPREPRDLATHETAWPFGGDKASIRGAGIAGRGVAAGARRSTKRRSAGSSAGDARPPRPSIACDDFAVILEVARAGGGVAVLPLHLAKPHVRDGALIRLLPGVVLDGAPLFLVTRRERPLAARVEALRDHLVANVASLLA